MRDRRRRAFLVIAGVSAAGAWTWPGGCPEADPVAVLVRSHTPNCYAAVVGWHDVAPGVAVFLAGPFLLSTARISFASRVNWSFPISCFFSSFSFSFLSIASASPSG